VLLIITNGRRSVFALIRPVFLVKLELPAKTVPGGLKGFNVYLYFSFSYYLSLIFSENTPHNYEFEVLSRLSVGHTYATFLHFCEVLNPAGIDYSNDKFP
jgi:hypothetical protein